MKNGTLYAKRVKRAFAKLKNEHGVPDMPEPSNPIDQLIIGLLSVDAAGSRAVRAATTLKDAMVDINEVRVSTSAEISAAIGSTVPNSLVRADAVRRALNAVYRKEHAVTLDHLHKAGRRDAKHYLEALDGVDHCAAASVLLWSLGGHAIPVDQRMYEALRKDDLVEPSASVAEVQAFLERNIGATDAKAFCLLMQKFTPTKGQRSGGAPSGKSASSRKPKSKPTGRSPAVTKKAARKPATKRTKRTVSP